jgi:hypothetical protein
MKKTLLILAGLGLLIGMITSCTKTDYVYLPVPQFGEHWQQSGSGVGIDTTNFKLTGTLIVTFPSDTVSTEYSKYLFQNMPNGNYTIAFSFSSNQPVNIMPTGLSFYPYTTTGSYITKAIVTDGSLGFTIQRFKSNGSTFVQLNNIRVIQYGK